MEGSVGVVSSGVGVVAGVRAGVVVGVPGVGVGVGLSCLMGVVPRTTPPSGVQMSGTQHTSVDKGAGWGFG